MTNTTSSLNDITPEACCAHLHVKYNTAKHPAGGTVGWWACKSCGHRFMPIPVGDAALRSNPITLPKVSHGEQEILGAVKSGNSSCASPATDTLIGWLLPIDKINDLQRESIEHSIKRCKQAHYTNLKIRINGKDEEEEADWVKHLKAVYPQKMTLTDENCNEQITNIIMDLVELLGNFPEAKPDERAWEHLLVYAPKQEAVSSEIRVIDEEDIRCQIFDVIDCNVSQVPFNPDGNHPVMDKVMDIIRPYLRQTKREYKRVHGYEISGDRIYIGPMRPDRVKVSDITCTIDWDETYTDKAKQRRIHDAERICRGLDHE